MINSGAYRQYYKCSKIFSDTETFDRKVCVIATHKGMILKLVKMDQLSNLNIQIDQACSISTFMKSL